LLSPGDAHAGGSARYADHLHTRGFATLSSTARKRRGMGYPPVLRRATETKGLGASIYHRCGVPLGGPSGLILGDNIYYGHGLTELLSPDYSWRRGFLGGERRLSRPAHV